MTIDINQIIINTTKIWSGTFPIILCFYTGENEPSNCSPMKRNPEVRVGNSFNDKFVDDLLHANQLNPAVHDGAIMLGRVSGYQEYKITGWSYRLFPPPIQADVESNRGSAYCSCIAMSVIDKVDNIYLLNKDKILVFKNGKVQVLYSLP